MYEIMVRILNGDFDIQVENLAGRQPSRASVKLEPGINRLVEVESCSHAASYLRPVICRHTAVADIADMPEVAEQIKQNYRTEPTSLLSKVDTLDKDIIKKVRKAR